MDIVFGLTGLAVGVGVLLIGLFKTIGIVKEQVIKFLKLRTHGK